MNFNLKKIIGGVLFNLLCSISVAQTNWVKLDSFYQPLPSSVHIFKSTGLYEGKPNIMYYASMDLKDKNLLFTTDTSYNRRLTPHQFYEKNNHPLLVVNCSFFSFATNQNLNVVIRNGKLLSYNKATIAGKGKDTLTYFHSFFGTLGISRHGEPDIAWTYTDSSLKYAYSSQSPVYYIRDSVRDLSLNEIKKKMKLRSEADHFKKWKMKTAVGGGPVLLQNGEIRITNNEERKFAGKAINNPEPRTAIGYTEDNKLIVLVCEGRSDSARGLTLIQLAKILKDLGCIEALNLDGGGSSCMLINGKETNTPSSKGVQRPVPSVFIVKQK